MRFTRPEVIALGSARDVIRFQDMKAGGLLLDNISFPLLFTDGTAYQSDE
jgi:hypothetical protein